MKTIQTIIIFFLALNIGLSKQCLDNKLLIRINTIQLDDSKLNNDFSELGISLESRMLPLKASYLYGNISSFKSSNNEKIKKIIEAEKPLLRTYIVTFEGNEDALKFATKLQASSDLIEIAQPYYISELQGYTPNDTFIQNQDGALELIKAFDAWEIEKGSEDVVIAISDNGVQQTHEDLKDNIDINENEIPNNGIDDDENGYIDDYNGFNFDATEETQNWGNTFTADDHGTRAAGIAGASFDNNLGVAGIGGKSKIFPLRIGSDSIDSQYVVHDYKSIMYAAIREFDVINCSWGTPKTFSDIEQSVIDYAVAKDVVVIAAGGNLHNLEKYFPAGYEGVLGVGAVTAFDSEVNGSKGAHVKIHAPTSQNYTTTNNSSGSPYDNVSNATSFAAPVVAGAAAILRAHRPELDATEVMELLRQSTDDISEKRSFYKEITAGRLNMLKMLTVDPMSIPGIKLGKKTYYNSSGAIAEKFLVGDTVMLDLELNNVLGSADDLDFKLSLGYPEFPVLEFIDSEITAIPIGRNEIKTVGKFKFVVINQYDDYLIMRLDITRPNGYSDFLMFDFKPKSEMTTFENTKIKFSVSDVGTFGFESDSFSRNYKDGIGFINKNFGNGLFRAGVFAIEDDINVITSLAVTTDESEFMTINPYGNPRNTASFLSNDPFRDTKIEIQQTIELPKTLPWVRIKIDMIDSAAFGSQYTVGYEFDWDIGIDWDYRKNRTSFLPNARPSNIPSEKFAAISTSDANGTISFGVSMYSEDEDAVAQAAGYTSENSVSSSVLTTSMQSGKTIITDEIEDIYNLIGIRYTGSFDDYESKTCYLCVSSAENNDILASNLKECSSGISSVELDKYNESIEFIDNRLEVNNSSYIKTEVYDLTGKLIDSITTNTINLNQLNQGVYLVRIEFEDGFIIKKVAITH